MTSENQNQNQNQNSGDKLYAGKFKTVEELETGYTNAAKVYQENETLKKQVTDATKVPDDYSTPTGVALHEADLAETKRLAKESGMTQAQYEKFVKQTEAKSRSQHETFEAAKKEIGADQLNILQDYVKKAYPEKLHDAVLKTLIKDKDARAAALEHRQKLLNNRVPGMETPGAGYDHDVTYDDVLKAREAHQKNKGDMKLRKRYLDMTARYAHAKKQG